MRKLFTAIAFIIAAPFIIAGALWRFAADAFNAGVGVGQMIIDYLSEV